MMLLPAHEEIDSQWGESPSRVLIVDDEPLIRWSLAAGLRLGGFDTVAASSASEAIALAGTYPHPDAILVDLDLFDAKPAAFLAELKSAAPGCRFLLMTTSAETMSSHESDTRVVRKPFDLVDVVRLVRSLLDAYSIHPATAAAEPAG